MSGRPAYDVAPPAPRRPRPGAVAAMRPWHRVKVGGRRVLTRSPVHPPHSAQGHARAECRGVQGHRRRSRSDGSVWGRGPRTGSPWTPWGDIETIRAQGDGFALDHTGVGGPHQGAVARFGSVPPIGILAHIG